MSFPRFVLPIAVLAVAAAATSALAASPLDPSDALRGVLHWRAIGPFRGGRTVAVTGVPGRLHTFYIAAVDGGIFATNDTGRTWRPIFDDQPTASIGALAVAPSQPDTIYAGSGEGLQRPDLSVGDGMYKSTDAGAHWTHLGLRDGQQIAKIVIDPHDANRLYIAVLGHPYGPNSERGVYRSTDGGATFARVLSPNADTGAFDLALDPADSHVLYASLWAARQPPWETLSGASFAMPSAGTGLYKSTDGGTTWTRLEGGLPTVAQGVGRIAVAVAPSDPTHVYAFADAHERGGLYRSRDGGATWTLANATARIAERGDDLATVGVDPRNPDVVYVTNTSTYISVDGGATFTALRGAPGGDDYHSIWIAPGDPQTIVLGSDQGAVISVNGGASWSSWYNQPTAQFYHVATDNRFPYRVYGGQQESGSAAVSSRGNDGVIGVREWHPVGVEEYGYVAPDPLHPGIVYGGKVTRTDERTGQVREVGPVIGWRSNRRYRFKRTAPLAFSPADAHALYLGANVVLRTRDGGAHWREISPDLTRPDPATPPNVGIYAQTDSAKRPHRGVVYALGLSPRDAKVVWAGTDDGLVWRTADGGGHWTNVTPAGIGSWAKISIIDASPFDAASAYVAVNRFRLDDQRPQLYRTHDGGRTWTEIDRGIENAPTNVIRADPARAGLLYAGTERGVWVSFDDGTSWSSLRLDLPATSVRDLTVHGADIVVATHGRGFYVLDGVGPLRALDRMQKAPALLAPAAAWRVARDTNPDTPLPPDEPFFANPPDGAVIDYALPPNASPPFALTFSDAHGRTLRRFTSSDRVVPVDPASLEVPAWWIAPPLVLDASAGIHRFVWDLRLAAPRVAEPGPGIAAVPHATPLDPQGATVPPGSYLVTLDAGAAHVTRRFDVRQDPRLPVPLAALQAQFELARAVGVAMDRAFAAASAARTSNPESAKRFDAIDNALAAIFDAVTSGDGAPTDVERTAYRAQAGLLDAAVRTARRNDGGRGGTSTL